MRAFFHGLHGVQRLPLLRFRRMRPGIDQLCPGIGESQADSRYWPPSSPPALLGRYWRGRSGGGGRPAQGYDCRALELLGHQGFDKMIEPFAKAGIETWVAPATPTGSKSTRWPRPPSETSGLYSRRAAAGFHRLPDYRLERRRRGPLQHRCYGLLFGAVAAGKRARAQSQTTRMRTARFSRQPAEK